MPGCAGVSSSALQLPPSSGFFGKSVGSFGTPTSVGSFGVAGVDAVVEVVAGVPPSAVFEVVAGVVAVVVPGVVAPVVAGVDVTACMISLTREGPLPRRRVG